MIDGFMPRILPESFDIPCAQAFPFRILWPPQKAGGSFLVLHTPGMAA